MALSGFLSKKRFLLLLLPLMVFSACKEKPNAPQRDTVTYYRNYQDIPGVTQEEIKAIEEIKRTRPFLLYGANPSTEAFYREDGTPGGYCGLLLQRLSDLFGIPFKLGIYEWGDLLAGLRDYSIDLSGELTATPDRQRIYFMTMSSSERSIKVMRLIGSQPLDRIARQHPISYGFLSNTTTLDLVKPFIDPGSNIVQVEDYIEAHKLLISGDIDAFFEESPAEAAFDEFGDVLAEDFFPLIYSHVSLTTGNPELSPLITVLDKYLQNGGIQELATFNTQGYREYQHHKYLSQLTQDERSYLLNKLLYGGEIPIAAEFDNYPLCFWNEQEKEYQGIAIDTMNEISKLTNLNFVPQNKYTDGWATLQKMLETGQVSMVSELIPSDERKGLFLWSSLPYATDYYAMISKLEYPEVSINEVLYNRVGLIKDTAHEQIFREWFPNHKNIVELNSNPEAVDALDNGSIDLLMADNNTLLWITNYLEMPGFKANIVFNRPRDSYFGFNKNEAMLCSIISKAQKLIDSSAIADRWTRRVFDYRGKMARAQVPWLAGSLVLFALVMALLVILLLRNRNEGRRLESVIHQRTRDLEEQTTAAMIASRAKGEFLAHMSHEIRTPLNAIIGMTLIAQKNSETEKTKASLEEISVASNHLLGILNDILDMAKIESGKFALIHEPFEIISALQEVSEIIKMRCQEKQIEFIQFYKYIPKLTVLGDKLRLKQVLINLLGNSVKFTPEHGRVELRCEIAKTEAREVFFYFSITDSGIGMSEEQIKKLFNAFEQTDSKIAVNYGGTGLGLVISQDLVTQMGGQISVKSKPGEGSVFSFTIGLEITDEIKQEIQVPDNFVPDLNDKHILLAEDIDINRVIIIELLSETHVKIDEAVDGQDAVNKFAEKEPGYYDFIFMDVQMPVMNGYEATRRIREIENERFAQNPAARPIPIYAMTANAYREDIDKAIQAGMNGHIAKPVDIKIIMKILSEQFSFVSKTASGA